MAVGVVGGLVGVGVGVASHVVHAEGILFATINAEITAIVHVGSC